ncbi:MAG TPA: DNA alkylation repair protein [Longilinea sp.]|nr:DNA alkylation repair protein [Longilinea sp.]
MPAVQLVRLKKQIEDLSGLFAQPEDFLARLRFIFEQYGDLTYHAGQATKPVSLLPTYRAPAMLMKQLEINLAPLCAARPLEALTIIDLLWQEEFLEPRQLACSLLGQTALTPFQAIINRLESWPKDTQDTNLIDALFSAGSERLRREVPNRWLDVLRDWMGTSDLPLHKNALIALLPFILDREFENLPVVYNLITPSLQQDSADLPSELQKVLAGLARRSPIETGYFLRQILATNNETSLQRLVRRCLPSFPLETQIRLKAALQARSTPQNDA